MRATKRAIIAMTAGKPEINGNAHGVKRAVRVSYGILSIDIYDKIDLTLPKSGNSEMRICWFSPNIMHDLDLIAP